MKKLIKKCNLWVREQCICALFTAEVNNCGYCSLNSNHNTPMKTREKKKKKKKQKRNATQLKSNPNTH